MTALGSTMRDIEKMKLGDLIFAARKGRLSDVVLLLQDKSLDPSDRMNYPIQSAAIAGNIEIVKLLLHDKRVDPADADNYAIRHAANHERLDVFNLLWHFDSIREYYE